MTSQNYCLIDNATNICTNVVFWDGNTETWTPPSDCTVLIQSTTPAKTWVYDLTTSEWILSEEIGAGDIGFSWDGTYLITYQPKPAPFKPQPATSGTQTL